MLWTSARCWLWAPGGVSQRSCQSLWTDLTAACALACRTANDARATIKTSHLLVRQSARRLIEHMFVTPGIWGQTAETAKLIEARLRSIEMMCDASFMGLDPQSRIAST